MELQSTQEEILRLPQMRILYWEQKHRGMRMNCIEAERKSLEPAEMPAERNMWHLPEYWIMQDWRQDRQEARYWTVVWTS